MGKLSDWNDKRKHVTSRPSSWLDPIGVTDVEILQATGKALSDAIKPDFPEPPAMPGPPPAGADPAVIRAQEEERKRRMLSTGRASTMLTGGTGVEGGTTSARRMLLGY